MKGGIGNWKFEFEFFLDHEGARRFTKLHEVFFNAVAVVGEGH